MTEAQAMLNAAIAQRNRAMDEAIQLAAMFTMLQEKIAALEAKPAEVSNVTSIAPAA